MQFHYFNLGYTLWLAIIIIIFIITNFALK